MNRLQRKNNKQYVQLICHYCHKTFFKEKKEYIRQIKRGRDIFYCGLSCATYLNPGVLKQREYAKSHPEETYNTMISSPKYKKRAKDEYSSFRIYLTNLNNRLKNFSKRKTTCDLDFYFLKELWEKQKGICPYSGLKMELKTSHNKRATPFQASLDRIISGKDYTKDNVEFVCLAVNYAKNSFPKGQMTDFFNKVRETQKIV